MYSEHHSSVTAHRTRVGFSIPVSFSVAIQLLIYLVIPFFYFIQINSVYQSWFWLDIGTSGSHTRLSWTIFCLPPLSPNMDSFLQKETEHSWDLRLIIWQLSLLWMRSSTSLETQNAFLDQLLASGYIHMYMCKHWHNFIYHTPNLYSKRHSFSQWKHNFHQAQESAWPQFVQGGKHFRASNFN